MTNRLKLRAGDWVEVRKKEEILKTLDQRGCLDNLPFMPEMLRFCGKRFRVFKRAHKTCDTVNRPAGLRMNSAVHLEGLRCNGEAHAGCQAECLIFWKEAWLQRAEGEDQACGERRVRLDPQEAGSPSAAENEEVVWNGTRAAGEDPNATDPTYTCQATQLPLATSLLPWWDLRQYVEDLCSGNASLRQLLAAFLFVSYFKIINAGIGLGAPLRRLYDIVQKVRGGVPYPFRVGLVEAGVKTPSQVLDLKAGETVRIKPYAEILPTLDRHRRNRGLGFDAEMVPYCGGVYRVLKRVDRIINEKTGKLMVMKNSCIMLEGVVCQSRYSSYRILCPRSIHSYWREIWLERVASAEEDRRHHSDVGRV